MSKLDKLKKQYEKLGKEIEVLEHSNRYQDITVMVPSVSNLFVDFRKRHTYEHQFVVANIRLYEPTTERYTFDEAVNKFNDPDTGRLMTKQEIHFLIALGYLSRGSTSFWSSSVCSTDRFYAWLFYGSNGDLNHNGRISDRAVRCVGRL